MDGLSNYQTSRVVWVLISLLLIVGFILGISIRIIEASNSEVLEVCKEGCRHTSIQAAIDAADSGDTVTIENGTYKENLAVDKDLTLKGTGQEKVTVKSAKKDHPVLLIGPSKINVKVEGMKLTGAWGSCADLEKGICPFGISITGKAEATIKSSTISDNLGGIKLLGPSQLIIKSTSISGNEWDAIQLWDSSQATIIGSTISDHRYGIYLHHSSQATITDSTISDNYGGIYLYDSSQAKINNNKIVNNLGAGIRSSSDRKVQGATNQMVDNGVALVGNVSNELRNPCRKATQEEVIFPNTEYPTLQHAIDAILPGGAILIKKGIYTSGITIGKAMTIKPQGHNQPVLEGKGFTTISLIKGGNLRLEGIKVTGKGYGLLLGSTAKATVTASTISDNGQGGIELWDSSEAIITGNHITGNEEEGIWLESSSHATITGNQIKGNLEGIGLEDSSHATIKDSTISSNGGVGISISGLAQTTSIDNDITGNGVGIVLRASSQVTITNSTISGNYCGILLSDSSQTTIEGNQITNNEGYGIVLYVQECGFDDAPEEFEGKVEGKANQFSRNGKGPVCPETLDFLSTEETKE